MFEAAIPYKDEFYQGYVTLSVYHDEGMIELHDLHDITDCQFTDDDGVEHSCTAERLELAKAHIWGVISERWDDYQDKVEC